MKARNLLLWGGITFLLSGCATTEQPPVEKPQMLVKENKTLVENSAENIPKPSEPAPAPPPMKEADKQQAANDAGMDCGLKGKPVMLDGRRLGITIELGYCSADIKPEGSKIWIPESEVPMLGNIRVEDECNITYCPTSPHYDHFGITDGKNSTQVQVRWENHQPIVY